jgi:TPR repeat protein
MGIGSAIVRFRRVAPARQCGTTSLGPGKATAAAVLISLVFLLLAIVPSLAAERRVALVLGNSEYSSLPELKNPTNDTAEVAKVLRRAGFEVISAADQDRLAVEATIERFFRSLNGADVSLFYYSGHAIQLAGANYIVPTDAKLASPYDIEIQTINIETILSQMRIKTRMQFVFLDACRDNPFRSERFWIADHLQRVDNAKGLAQIRPGIGTLISFSTEPGSVAYDGKGALSPFSGSFVSRALTPNREIRALLTEVRRDVIEATDGRQIPWENSSLTESFFLMDRKLPPLVASMHRVSVPENGLARLRPPEPQVFDDVALQVTFDLLPDQGRLLADGEVVSSGRRYPAAVINTVVFDATGIAEGFVGLVGYTVHDPYGQSARGVVALTVEGAGESTRSGRIVVAGPPTLELRHEVDEFADSLQRTIRPVIGVGPISLDLPPFRQTEQQTAPNLVISSVPSKGILRVGERTVHSGARISAAEIGAMTYEPQVGSQGQAFTIEATPGESDRKVAIRLEPTLHECDITAAEPLDLGSVAPGVLPNEIDTSRALPACTEAMQTYPQVARFLFQLGRAQLAARDIDAAWNSFEESAARHHVRALHQLGYMYAVGAGRPADRSKANDYYKQNADLGDPYGIYNYGRAVFYGRGLDANVPMGLELMLRAAEMGHTYAMNELGAIFLYGRNVERDQARAIEFYKAGLARKDIYSMNNLGLAYLEGSGVRKDFGRARELFSAASQGGHPAAPSNLGRMYRDGISVRRNTVEAARWFERSAERGDAWGAFWRGELAAQSRPARDLATTARFIALAVALDRTGTNTAWKERLAGLPLAAKQQAARELARELSGERIPSDADLDSGLVEIARAAWQKRNPRVDLF